VLAALGCALKPQYGLAFAALEVVALSHRIRPLRAAPIAAAATLTAYVGFGRLRLSGLFATRPFPWRWRCTARPTFSCSALLLTSAPLLAAEGLRIFLGGAIGGRSTMQPFDDRHGVRRGHRGRDLLHRWQGLFYHRLPATVVTLLVLILWAASTLRHRPDDQPAGACRGFELTAAGIMVGLFCVSAVQRLEPEVRQAVEPTGDHRSPAGGIDPSASRADILAFSEWIALGFPVGEQYGRDLGFTVRLDVGAEGRIVAGAHRSGGVQEGRSLIGFAHDFIAGCPDIAVVDTRRLG